MNLKKKKQHLNECIEDLYKVIEQLSEDLERLEAKEDHSKKFAHFKRFQVKNILNAANAFEEYQTESGTQYKILAGQNANLRNEIDKLEIICLMHGINNFPFYIKHSKNNLLQMLKEHIEQKTRQIPVMIFERGRDQEIPFDIDKHGNRVYEKEVREVPKTTNKPITSFKGLTFKK